MAGGDDAWAAAGSAGERQRLRSALGLRRRTGAPAQARGVPHRTAASYPRCSYLYVNISKPKELQRRGEDLNLRRQDY